MKILITGGAGFNGSCLAKSLLEDGHEIFIIDNFNTSKQSNISDIINRINFLELNLDNNDTCEAEKIISEMDVIYHFASSIGVKLIQEKPTISLHNSMNINNHLLPLFELYQKKVIFSSTSEVYGETKNRDGSRETDNLEIYPSQKPRGSYACSKLMTEFLIRSYTFPNTIVRFFNIVGPTQLPDYGHVLPRFIDKIINKEDLVVYGDGKQIRSFCDIRDAVEMLKLLINDVHNNEIYNIGNDKNICTINELADACIDILKSKSNIKHITFEEALGKQFEEIFIRYPNTNKIKQYYTCKYDLNDIIRNL